MKHSRLKSVNNECMTARSAFAHISYGINSSNHTLVNNGEPQTSIPCSTKKDREQ